MEPFNLSNELLTQSAQYLAKVPGAIVTLLATWIIIRLVKKLVKTATQLTKADPTAQSLLSSGVGFVGWVIGIAATLNALGLQQISLALGGSVALVAMALATGLNTISQDLLAGIFLLSDDDFNIGAKVRATGLEGEIMKLTIRKTKIRDRDGVLHVIPNRNIDAATFTIISPAPGRDKQLKQETAEPAEEPKAG
ncbi:MAG TPA: mechanosensitive ion channel family protein [Firmicutes bacterium]|jgi:small-conductance mechanosensitive channel|nr:mechanosensitive ion channel family protein [Bacillota bacterium]